MSYCEYLVCYYPVNRVDPSGHADVGCVAERGASTCHIQSGYVPEPLPSDYVLIEITYSDGRKDHLTAGAAIETNVILTHNHHLSSGVTPADIQEINIFASTDTSIPLLSAGPGDFLMAGDQELGGGLGLFVFKNDFIKPENTVPLGNANDLEIGDFTQQSVFNGSDPGLYQTWITDKYSPTNIRGVKYQAIVVYPDFTTGNDSGSPLYANSHVYGINNSGSGIYGAVFDIGLINNLVNNMTGQLR